MLATNPKNIVVSTKDLSVLDFSLMSFMSYESKEKNVSIFQGGLIYDARSLPSKGRL